MVKEAKDMFCGECGKKIDDQAKYCPYCGSPTENVEEEFFETPVQDEITDEELEEEIVYTEDGSNEKGSSATTKKVVLVILILVILGVVVFFVWKLFFAKTENDHAAVTTEATVGKKTESDDVITDDKKQEAEGTSDAKLEDGLPIVYADDSVDYSKTLSTDKYEVFKADEGYSFAYPKNFYNDVFKIDGGYSFTGDDDVSAFEIYKESNSYSSVSDTIEGYYDSAQSNMNVYEKIIYSPENGKLILAAKNKFDSDIYYYYLVKATSDSVQVMKVTYPYSSSESKESENQKNYFVDCLYRYCSFSGGTYKPRTYSQFKNDDMGTKK